MLDAWAAGAALLKPRDHEAEKLALQDPSVWGSWRPRSNPTPGEHEPDMVKLRLLQQLQREQQSQSADTCRRIQALHPNVMAKHPGATPQASPPGDVHPAREAAAGLPPARGVATGGECASAGQPDAQPQVANSILGGRGHFARPPLHQTMQPHSQLSDADRSENQAMVGMYLKQPVGWGGRLDVPDFQYEGSYQWNLKNPHTAQGLIQGSCE